MKYSKEISCLFALMYLILYPGSLFANEGEIGKKYAIGAAVAGAFPEDSDIDNNLYWGGIATYDIVKYAAIGVESGFMRWEDKVGNNKHGNIHAWPLLGDMIVKYPVDIGDFELAPYGVLGLGMIFWDYHESEILRVNNISVDMDNAFAIKFGCGMDIFTSSGVGLFIEGSYIWSDTKAESTGRGSALEVSVNTDMWMLSTGVKIKM